MSESDGANGPLRKRIKTDLGAEGKEDMGVAAMANNAMSNQNSANIGEPPALTPSQQVLQQINAQNAAAVAAAPANNSKSRGVRLEQNRVAARESRKRKKVMVEELQRSVIFFSRANAFLKQQNDEYTRMLAQAQAAVQQQMQQQQQQMQQQQQSINVGAPQASNADPNATLQQPQASPIQPQTVESIQQPQQVASAGPVSAASTSAEQAAQAQAVARAAAQQFAPQYAAMFGAAASRSQPQGATHDPTQYPPTAAPTTPLQVAVAAASLAANGNILGSYPTQIPGSGPYADAFQNAIFQQQAAAAAVTTGATAAAVAQQNNFASNVPAMNFGGPFQQAALAQHFGQNMSALQNSFPQNVMHNAPVAVNPAPSAPQTNNASSAQANAPVASAVST